MGLQFMAAMAGVISVLMVLGTIFVSRMLINGQYRNIELRGRELGLFLGKAGTDASFSRTMSRSMPLSRKLFLRRMWFTFILPTSAGRS